MFDAIFLDRDGTINIDKNYVHKRDQLEFCTNAIEGLVKLTKCARKLIVVTNQSGIGRGYFTSEEVDDFNKYLNTRLAKHNLEIEDFLVCPHTPTDGCKCRKPKIGLFTRAKEKFNITNGVMIGDKISDVQAGMNAGLISVLLTSQPVNPSQKYLHARDLLDAATVIGKL